MEFQDYATQETAALLGRLLSGQSDASRQHLQAMRDALDAAARAVETHPPLESEIQALVGRLTQAAGDAVRRVQDDAGASLAAVQSDLEATRAEKERLAAVLAEVEASSAALQTALEQEHERAEAADRDLAVTVEAHTELEAAFRSTEATCRQETQARASLDEQLLETRGLLDMALGETTQLRSELDGRLSENATLTAALNAARAAHEELEAAHRTADGAAQYEAQARAALQKELLEARSLLELALGETEQIRGQREQLEQQAAEQAAARGEMAAQIDAANARVQMLEGQLADAAQAAMQLQERVVHDEQQSTGTHAEVTNLREELDRMVSILDAAVLATDDLSSAGTVGELLAALSRRLSIHFSRVAIFRLKGNRLEGEEEAGFDETSDVTKLALPLNLDSLMTRVVSSGAVEYLSGSELASRGGTPFGGAPAAALAMPVVLQGQTIAVVYADHAQMAAGAGDAITRESSIGFAKLLVAQTVMLLMRHTEELKMLAELRDYAVMLLQEAEHMYVADGEANKSEADLRKRLKDNLDCACQLYAHRAALEGTAAAGLLDEQIAVAIEAGTPFAHDLAAILDQSCQTDPLCTAEAS